MNDSKQALIIGVVVVAAIALFFLVAGKPAEAPPADSGTATNPAPATSPTSLFYPATKPAAPATNSYPSMTKDGIYLIYYTRSGFSPSTITVPLGKSVRFVNDSGKAMRIASTDTTNNPIFVSFNQPKTVGQGGIYEYTFVNSAVYSYANLNNQADQGVITVK